MTSEILSLKGPIPPVELGQYQDTAPFSYLAEVYEGTGRLAAGLHRTAKENPNDQHSVKWLRFLRRYNAAISTLRSLMEPEGAYDFNEGLVCAMESFTYLINNPDLPDQPGEEELESQLQQLADAQEFYKGITAQTGLK